jgi:uncharacterized membrane protein
MYSGQYHYLPLSPLFFSFLVGIFLIVLILLMLNAWRQAFVSLGVSPSTAMLLLFGSLIGSYFNIPVADFPQEKVVSDQVIDFFGMEYTVPVVQWTGTVIAVNVGGAVIPTVMSLYLLFTRNLWLNGAIAIAAVALILHWLATPVRSAPLAYIGGSIGTLIGADLTNLDKVRGLGAPVASIGGAGTFDGIFLTGILAVLLASLYHPRRYAT